jgi:SAM-dependent methyltransferase
MNELPHTEVSTSFMPTTTQLRERACAICGTSAEQRWMEPRVDFSALDDFAFASRKLPEYMHFALALCSNCDLVFADQVPDSDWFKACYREANFDAVNESRYAAKTYGLALQRIVPMFTNMRSALDIGAGDGSFVAELIKAGFDQVIGVEPSIEPVSRALPSVKHLLRNDFFKPEDFQENSFDLITCFQTLEHLEDPLALCKSAHALLKSGGILLTVAHNFRAPLARLLGERSPIYDIEHLQLFSPQSLSRLYMRAGFSHVEVQSLRNAYPLHYWLKLLPLPKSAKRVLLAQLKTHRLGQWLIAAKVGNMIAVGIKR